MMRWRIYKSKTIHRWVAICTTRRLGPAVVGPLNGFDTFQEAQAATWADMTAQRVWELS